MKVSLYLVIAQWAILFGLALLLIVLYRQLGRVFGAKEPTKYGLPPRNHGAGLRIPTG